MDCFDGDFLEKIVVGLRLFSDNRSGCNPIWRKGSQRISVAYNFVSVLFFQQDNHHSEQATKYIYFRVQM